MNLLSFLLRASRSIIALSLAAGLVSGLSGVGLIALIHRELGRSPGEASPTRLALAFGALCLVACFARVVSQASMVRVGQETIFKLCLHICRKILSVPLRRFEELDSSALVAVLTEDVLTVANGIAGIPLLGINLPILLACLVYVGWLSPPVLVCGILFTVPAIAVNTFLMSRAVRQLMKARAEQDALVGHFRSMIDGFRELKLHEGRREAFVREGLEASTSRARDLNTNGLTYYALSASWGQLAYFGFIGFILFVLPSLYEISRQALAGATLVVLFLMAPLDVILAWVPILGRAGVSLRRIQALDPAVENLGPFEEPAHSPSQPEAPPAFESSLELSGVRYAYNRDDQPSAFALGPIDLTLRPQEIVFLVGGNGSGKTTLVKLLAGLYDCDENAGEIKLDGRVITASDLDSYRSLFTAVFADGHLFKNVLGLGLDPVDLDTKASAELARLELDGMVQVNQGTFSTTDLSQGQRKRLALIAALLEDRPICILDEWASHQDPQFKKTFYLEILPEWRARGKTLVVISHDEDYFHTADRVIRLDSGRILDHETNLASSQSLG